MRFKLVFLLLLGGLAARAQDSAGILHIGPGSGTGEQPLLFVDSVRTPYDSIRSMNGLTVADIAMVTVISGAESHGKFGDEGKNGIIYIESKTFARRRYNRVFSAVSADYALALQKYGSDADFQYVLDGMVLAEKDEVSMLTALDMKKPPSITVISGKEIKKQYHIKHKKAGVIISSKG